MDWHVYEYRTRSLVRIICRIISGFLVRFRITRHSAKRRESRVESTHGAFEKRALPVALEAYKLASDPRALGKKTVNA